MADQPRAARPRGRCWPLRPTRSWPSAPTGPRWPGTRRPSGCSAGPPPRSSASRRRSSRPSSRPSTTRCSSGSATAARSRSPPGGSARTAACSTCVSTPARCWTAAGWLGWVNVCHTSGGDDAARHYMAERARVVRRLGDVVADMNAQLKLEAVLDRIAASLRELTRADAGGFVLIEGDRLRLVSLDGLPASLRGRTADLDSSMVGELMRSGKTVMMATADYRRLRRPDLVRAARPAHDHAQPVARGRPAVRRAVRPLQRAPGRAHRAGTARAAGRARQRRAVAT